MKDFQDTVFEGAGGATDKSDDTYFSMIDKTNYWITPRKDGVVEIEFKLKRGTGVTDLLVSIAPAGVTIVERAPNSITSTIQRSHSGITLQKHGTIYHLADEERSNKESPVDHTTTYRKVEELTRAEPTLTNTIKNVLTAIQACQGLALSDVQKEAVRNLNSDYKGLAIGR